MDNELRPDERAPAHVEEVERAAAAWLLRREESQWTAEDAAALADWLRASTSHRVSFMRLQSVWQEAARLKVVSGVTEAGQVPSRGAIASAPFFALKGGSRRNEYPGSTSMEADLAHASERKPVQRAKHYAVAAAVVVVIAALGLVTLSPWPRDSQLYSTAIGGLATVPIEDGSRITLNTDSEVRLEINKQERRVNLVRGEAFFDVAEDSARPFVVYANDKRIVAVGTQFAVRLQATTLQVAVTEGHVRIERTSVIGATQPLADLVAGNLATAAHNMVRVQEKAVSDVEQTLSWRSGYVVLSRTLLGDAVAEFNRYNRRQLVIADPSLAAIQVGGNFKSDNIDGFVRLLEEGFAIQAAELDGEVVLTRKP
jgi:transmembrane sensor